MEYNFWNICDHKGIVEKSSVKHIAIQEKTMAGYG